MVGRWRGAAGVEGWQRRRRRRPPPCQHGLSPSTSALSPLQHVRVCSSLGNASHSVSKALIITKYIHTIKITPPTVPFPCGPKCPAPIQPDPRRLFDRILCPLGTFPLRTPDNNAPSKQPLASRTPNPAAQPAVHAALSSTLPTTAFIHKYQAHTTRSPNDHSRK